MKKIKKIFALLIAMVMVLGMSTSVFAASITITRDDSYNGTGDGRSYKYYKVFSASYDDVNKSDGFEGGHTDGNPAFEQGDRKVSYTATAIVATKLDNTANLWFDVQDISGSTDKVITWKDGVNVDADTIQAAAAWLIENEVYESGPVEMNFNNGKWTSGDIDAGYYVIASDTGKNFAAVTTDITIEEKNTYPSMDKTQADEDNETQRDDKVNVAVGDVVTYQAKITIPKTPKVGDTIVVTDTPSSGLTYNDDVNVKSNTGIAIVNYGSKAQGQAWTATITVTEGSQGKDVIFEYTMTINDNALTDSNRVNTLELQYGDKYTAIPDSVYYTTYFTGIEKIDGNNDALKLEGVKFALKENDVEFKVSKDTEGYYVPDANGSSEVVTNANGLILIRGLDCEKTYTLTETETLPGYNMLENDVTLSLVEDKNNEFNDYDVSHYQDVQNNTGTVLPSTGGVGTTMFYVIGGALVLVAVVLLVTRKRMSVKK